MIDNNLDFEVALYPYELVTYGETGSVCQNWLQYNLIKRYLEEMTDEQTLVVESGHPLGLFPSKPEAPRVSPARSHVFPSSDFPPFKSCTNAFFIQDIIENGWLRSIGDDHICSGIHAYFCSG